MTTVYILQPRYGKDGSDSLTTDRRGNVAGRKESGIMIWLSMAKIRTVRDEENPEVSLE